MVAITTRNLLLVAAAIIGAAPFTSAQRLYDDGSLSLRDVEDYYSDLSARAYEPLSIREYIDEQFELALRDYDEVFDELTARATQKEIDEKLKTWTAREKDAKKKLKAAQDKEREAKKALDKDPKNEEKKKAHRRAGDAVNTLRDSLEGARDEIEYWKKAKASPSPAGSPKGSPRKK
ncbi:hypothetical protein BKA70DRAFT_1229407 [Coprinopsis sp. MPI-PUGE-AT-0042]|nr:hypothetical protein BKA70DRAFT_1229407 [Coprinopsis sp. MPI-PUGE-AT-0042]